MLRVLKMDIGGRVRRRISSEIAVRVAGLILATLAGFGYLEGVAPETLEESEAALAVLMLAVAEILAQIRKRHRDAEHLK